MSVESVMKVNKVPQLRTTSNQVHTPQFKTKLLLYGYLTALFQCDMASLFR